MKLLHTSDWHLGQSFYSYDRYQEHEQVLAWLVEQIEVEQPDCLLIAGDIFDTANPSSAAQKQFYRFIRQASHCCPGLQIVAIAGNHDSPGRVEAPKPLLDEFGVTVVGSVQRNAEGQIDIDSLVYPLNDRQGDTAAWCLAIPFLRPGDVPRLTGEQADTADSGSGDPYRAGVEALYAQALAVAEQASGARDLPIIAMGHCHLTGAAVSELSERRLIIGGSEALSATMFGDQLSYVALGHLHKPQQVGQAHIRYSGSLMPMSFAERHYPHQVVKVELQGRAPAHYEPLRIPRCADLLRIPDQAAPIEEVLATLEALDLPDAPDFRQPYLEVRVLLEEPEPGLRTRVESALQGKPVRLARIDTHYRRQNLSPVNDDASTNELDQLQPEAVFLNLYAQKTGEPAPDTLLAAFREIASKAYNPEEPA